jgi:hypothetical protein
MSKTKFAFASAVVALSVAFAAPANATISFTTTPGSDPYIGPAPTYDFDTSTPTFSGGNVVGPGTTSGQFAQPYGSTGQYYSVGPSTSTQGTIDLSSFDNIYNLSFIWGSVDQYNTLEILSGSTVLGVLHGSDIFNPANGDQTNPNTNPIVTLFFDGGDEALVDGLRLSSDQNAFEIDNMAINGVPEPATWAMMLLGFGAVGFAMRRGRKALPQLA